MFERFNVGSRRVINDTYTQVKELNHAAIGTEHLLLSLVEDRESPSAMALARLGIFPNKVRSAVLAKFPRSDKPVEGKAVVSAPARLALQAATTEADEMGSEEVGPEHILLGLMRQPNTAAAKILTELGVKPADLRARIKPPAVIEDPLENTKGKKRRRGKKAAKETSVTAAETLAAGTAPIDDYYYDQEDADVIDFNDVVGGAEDATASYADAMGTATKYPTTRREWVRSLGAAAIIIVICALGLGGIYYLGRDTDSAAVTLSPTGQPSGSGQVLPTAPPSPSKGAEGVEKGKDVNQGDKDNNPKAGTPVERKDPDFGLEGFTPGTPNGKIVAVTDTFTAEPSSKAYTYDISVDEGLGMDTKKLAEGISAVLNDKRSWASDGYSAHQMTSGAQYHIFILSPAETDNRCSPGISQGYYSCTIGNSVFINSDRWFNGDESFIARGGTINEYRIYLLNRQMGLALGMEEAECKAVGELSPAMEAQTKSDSPCKANGWPYPNK